MILAFNWEGSSGFQNIMSIINGVISIIRWVVPIGLIVMTSLDIAKKVINPDDKDGQKKIMHRIIAAVVVFFTPVLVNIVLNLIGANNENASSLNNDSNDNNGTSDNTGKNNNSVLENVENMLINNCPSNNKIYDKGDIINLEANIIGGYTGNVNWIISSQNVASVTSNSNGRKANIKILDYYAIGQIQVTAQAQGKSITCPINVAIKPRTTGDIIINNCPKDKVKVGDTITISTNQKNVNWNNGYNFPYINYYSFVDNNDGSVTIKILKHYLDILPIYITVKDDDGKVGDCAIYTYE